MVVRIGVIGIGSMGTGHANYLLNGEIKNAELTCVCDIEQNKVNTFCKNHPEIKGYLNYEDLIGSGEADAVIIAVPHYLHPIIATYALRHNMHVIVEKPVGIYAENVAEMNKAAEESGKVFSSMFCVRTDPYFRKIKKLVQSGELGGIKRVNWIATDWYRPQAYHNSSAWRSSWKGEGGGVLVNQSPHNLDLIQWIFDLPESVTATAEFGKYYDIEVDDEATAILKYPTFSCVYIASTGETPGTNRLEISADMGKLVLEGGQIRFFRNVQSEREYNRNNKDVMDNAHWRVIGKINDKNGRELSAIPFPDDPDNDEWVQSKQQFTSPNADDGKETCTVILTFWLNGGGYPPEEMQQQAYIDDVAIKEYR